MHRPSSVVDGNMAYFHSCEYKDVYSYNSEKQTWSTLPQCPRTRSSLAVVNGLLTAIGGYDGNLNDTNQLFSLTGQRKWVENFPPMPTKRRATATVCSGKSLVVAGGYENTSDLNVVEVMDTVTSLWSTASSLPFATAYASATVCQNRIYLLGYNTSYEPRSVLAWSIFDLLQSCQSQSLGRWSKTFNQQQTAPAVWHQVADLSVCKSSCATVCGQLLAVGGGVESYENPSTAIHQYNTETNSWEVISHMPTARFYTLVAVLPDNKLMVVGGCTDRTTEIDKIEISTFQELAP